MSISRLNSDQVTAQDEPMPALIKRQEQANFQQNVTINTQEYPDLTGRDGTRKMAGNAPRRLKVATNGAGEYV